jgi:hypothetical protein
LEHSDDLRARILSLWSIRFHGDQDGLSFVEPVLRDLPASSASYVHHRATLAQWSVALQLSAISARAEKCPSLHDGALLAIATSPTLRS